MSYAEHRTRVFFDEKKSANFGNELLGNFSGFRLKMYDSTTDLRTWSPIQLENIQYFREFTESEPLWDKITRSTLAMSFMLGVKTKSELDILRHELAKYKQLKLTTEQKKQLDQSDVGEALSNRDSSFFDGFVKQFGKFRELKDTLVGKVIDSAVKIDEIDEEIVDEIKSLDESQRAAYRTELETDKNYDTNCTVTRSHLDNVSFDISMKDSSFDDDDDAEKEEESTTTSESQGNSHQELIISTESMMDALKNKLNMKETELEELRNVTLNLRDDLKKKEEQINRLLMDLEEVKCERRKLLQQQYIEMKKWKNEILDGRNIIKELRAKYVDMQQEYANQAQEIKDLKRQLLDVDSLQRERDSLAEKLEDVFTFVRDANFDGDFEGMKAVIRERNELKDLNKKLELQCHIQEDENKQLTQLITNIDNQREAMDREMNDLKVQLENKNKVIATAQGDMASMLEQLKEKRNLSKLLFSDQYSDKILDQAITNRINASKEKISDLSADLKGAGDEIGRGRNQIKLLQKNIELISQDFRHQINEKDSERKRYFDLYEEFKQKFNTTNSNLENLMNEIQQKNSKTENLKKEHIDLTNEIENLNMELKCKNERIIELENEKQTLQNKIGDLTNELEKQIIKMEVLNEKSEETCKKLKNSEIKISNLTAQIENLHEKTKEKNEIAKLQKQIIEYNREKEKYEITIKKLREEFENYRKTNKKLNNNLSNILNQKGTLEAKIAVIKEDINRISNDLENKIQLNANLMQLPETISSTVEIFKSRLKISETSDLSECSISNEIVCSVPTNFQDKSTQVDQKTDKNENYRSDLKIKEEKIKFLTAENRELTTDLKAERASHQKNVQRFQRVFEAILSTHHTSDNVTRETKKLRSNILINGSTLSPGNMRINSQSSVVTPVNQLNSEDWAVSMITDDTTNNTVAEERKNRKSNKDIKSKQR